MKSQSSCKLKQITSEHRTTLKIFAAASLATAFILNILWATGILMWGGYINGPVGVLERWVPVLFGSNYGPILIAVVTGILASAAHKSYSYYRG